MTGADSSQSAPGGRSAVGVTLHVVLRVDLRGAGHTSANPYPVGRQGAPPSREERGGGGDS